MRQLTYTTSHDLRSPISGLISIFDLIDTSRINDRETIELIEILKLAGEKLEQTLNNYVDALGEKHDEETPVEEVDLNESLNNVIHSISFLIQTSKVSIQSDFSKLPVIKFNKAYMESVFLNLITNSIKYACPDCQPVIRMHSEKAGNENRIIFSDN